jgi:hypothetical protein
MSTLQRNDARLVAVDPSRRAVLHRLSLEVLDRHHHCFADFAEKPSDEQQAAAIVFLDAFDVLDATGWQIDPADQPVTVSLTAGHVAELERLGTDLAHGIVDRLDQRAHTTDPAEIARLDALTAADRGVLADLAIITASYHRPRP